MKKLAIVLTILLCGIVCVTAYCYDSYNVEVVDVSIVSEEYEAFDISGHKYQLCHDENPLQDMMHSPETWKTNKYSIVLKNHLLLPIEMVEVWITPRDEDVMQYTSAKSQVILPNAVGECSVMLITKNMNSKTREALLTYYVWGIPRQMRVSIAA